MTRIYCYSKDCEFNEVDKQGNTICCREKINIEATSYCTNYIQCKVRDLNKK